MKLLKLKLENFQGVKSAEYVFGGDSASIFGDNATGKTTLFNAVTWLLFDRASTGAKGFTPKTKDANGDVHFLNHSVEALFDQDGREVLLKKVFYELYKKHRGSATEEFSGHSVDYYIDGVPAKEKEFKDSLLKLCGDFEKMKMLTMPDYFSEEMSWSDRRKLLLEICGDVNDDDVISQNEELTNLYEFLRMPGTSSQMYSVEDYKKIAQVTKAEINKKIQSIPERIDEAMRAIQDVEGLDITKLNEEIQNLSEREEQLREKKASAITDSEAEIRKAISEARAELMEKQAAYSKKCSEINSAALEKIAELEAHRAKADSDVLHKKSQLSLIEQKKKLMEEERVHLLKEYAAIQDEAFDANSTVCPTCGQRYPEEKVQNMKDSFLLSQSKRKEEINRRGEEECSKEKIELAEEEITALREEIEDINSGIIEILKKKIQEEKSTLKETAPFERTSDCTLLQEKIRQLEEEKKDAKEFTMRKIASIEDDLRECLNTLQDKKDTALKIRLAEAQQNRIQELKEEEKKLGARFEELEHGVYLCDLFTKTKVSLLTDKINQKFKNVRFRLFQEQINGGLKEDCEVMIPSSEGNLVPFVFANNAARINAGLEIIDTLSRHFGLAMPVFVDNAESVTNFMELDTQVIKLFVSEADKTLRMERGI